MGEVGKNFLDLFKNKRVKVVQKDNFIKDGWLRDYDDKFILLEFDDKRGKGRVIISLDFVASIQEL